MKKFVSAPTSSEDEDVGPRSTASSSSEVASSPSGGDLLKERRRDIEHQRNSDNEMVQSFLQKIISCFIKYKKFFSQQEDGFSFSSLVSTRRGLALCGIFVVREIKHTHYSLIQNNINRPTTPSCFPPWPSRSAAATSAYHGAEGWGSSWPSRWRYTRRCCITSCLNESGKVSDTFTLFSFAENGFKIFSVSQMEGQGLGPAQDGGGAQGRR